MDELLKAQAEIAQLREQLAEAYTIEPLEWVVTTHDDGSSSAWCRIAGIRLNVYHLDGMEWEWFGDTGGSTDGGDATDLADGMAKAEAWRRELMRRGWRKIIPNNF